MMTKFALLTILVCFALSQGVEGKDNQCIVNDNMSILDFIIYINCIYHELLETIANLSDETNVDILTCLLSMKALVSGVAHGKMWALKMVDSSSKLQSGFLIGNFIDMGQYDECVNVESPDATFKGMHCLTDIKITLPSNMTIEIDGSVLPISTLLGSNVLKLTLGYCFPSSCKTWIIENTFNLVANGGNKLLTNYELDITVDPSDCHFNKKPDYTPIEGVVMIFVLFAVFITSICTTADVFSIKHRIKNRQPYIAEQMLLAFSAHSNWKKIISTKSASGSISCINGFKALSISWVVIAHKYRYLATQPITNLMAIPEELKNWSKTLLLSAPLSVDTFFLISGLLNMYTFCFMRAKKRQYGPVDLVISYIHRYLRLTPAYAMMVAFTATWLYRMGDGPAWDRIVGTARNECQSQWMYNIIYLNNYINPETYCMMQSWYLAADMQMFWLSPLLIYPLWRWPWFGYIEVVILIVASIAMPFSISYFEEIKTPIPLTTNPEEQTKIMDELYLPTHTKAVAYVIGIFTGYLLYQMKQKKIELKISMLGAALLWILTAIFMSYSVLGGHWIAQFDHPYNRLESAFYIGFYRFFWSLSIMWIIIACVNDYSGPVNSILSWKAFGPIGKLSYSIYLTHIAVILYGIGSLRSPAYFRDYSMVQGFFGDMFITIICSIALSLLLESPLMTFEKIIFGGSRAANRARSRRTDPEEGEPSGISNINGGERLNY